VPQVQDHPHGMSDVTLTVTPTCPCQLQPPVLFLKVVWACTETMVCNQTVANWSSVHRVKICIAPWFVYIKIYIGPWFAYTGAQSTRHLGLQVLVASFHTGFVCILL
jgi:hypothetical protein